MFRNSDFGSQKPSQVSHPNEDLLSVAGASEDLLNLLKSGEECVALTVSLALFASALYSSGLEGSVLSLWRTLRCLT